MAQSIATTVFGQNSAVIREEIGDSVKQFLPSEDKVFKNIIFNPSAQVMSDNELGRDLIIKKRFHVAQGGVVRGGNVNNDFTLYGETATPHGSRGQRFDVAKTYPDPMEGSAPRAFGMSMRLTSEEYNLAIPASILRLEATPANIEEFVTPIFTGFARSLARRKANQWYTRRTQQFRLGSLGPNTGSNAYVLDSTAKTITFFPTEETAYRFTEGDRVDIFKAGTDQSETALPEHTRINENSGVRVRLFVSAVNPFTNEVVLVAEENTSNSSNINKEDGTSVAWSTVFTTTTLGNSVSFVAYADSYASADASFHGLYSYDDWFKYGTGSASAGNKYILGDAAITTTAMDYIDVSVHPEFRSAYFASVGDLTERILLRQLALVEMAMGRNGHMIDTLIASPGVSLNIFDQLVNTETRERSGGPANLSLGLNGMLQFKTPTGQSYSYFETPYLETGRMLGIRGGKNWGMYTPPDPAGAQKASYADSFNPINLLLPEISSQSGGMFPLLNTSGQLREAGQMPAYSRMQFFPINQIPGVVWDGVNVSRVFSDAVSS